MTNNNLKNQLYTCKIFISFPAFDEIQDWFVFIFSAYDFNGEIIDSNEGILQWIDDENLTSLNLWEGDKIFMDWLKRNDFFSAKFIYQNKSLVSHSVNFYSNSPQFIL